MGMTEDEILERVMNAKPLDVVCDKCGSDQITEISYGVPAWLQVDHPIDPRITALVEQHRIVLGGCIHSKDSPKFFCRDCGNKFGSLGAENRL